MFWVCRDAWIHPISFWIAPSENLDDPRISSSNKLRVAIIQIEEIQRMF